MPFDVGDKVVYPHHGAAVIERKEKKEAFGETNEYLVLKLAYGDLTLMVPTNKCDEVGLREVINDEEVEEVLRERPELLWGVVRLLVQRLRTTDAALADSVFLDVTGRTAKRLLDMANGEDEFTLPVTQEELAGMVGASRERVNKALSAFIRLGWLEQSERRYRITDREQLARRAR